MKLLKLKPLALAPVLIFVVSAAVRLININQPLLEFFPQRQTQTAEITRNIYVNGWSDFWTPKVRYFTNSPIPYVLEFPLYNGIVAIIYHLFDPNIIWGRIVSLIFFALSGIVFYRLVQSTISTKGRSTSGGNNQQLTIFSLLFFIFSPLHILISRSFQPEELALSLLLFAVYRRSWLIFSLAVLTKLPIVLFAPVLIYQQLRSQTSTVTPDLRQNLYIISAKMFASLIPSVVWYYRAGQLTTHPAIVRNFDLSNWFQPQLWFQSRWYAAIFQIEHVWVLTTLGLLFFWIGFWRFRQIKWGLWHAWLVCGILYLAVFNYHAMTHEYYHLFLLPPLSVIAGYGLTSIIYSTVLKHWSKLILSAGIIIMIVTSLSLPAIIKIISAPKSPEESEEITADRYHLIEDY